jgi:small subunit ribosomal protein S17
MTKRLRPTAVGTVLSHKMKKTAIVLVERRAREKRTGKVSVYEKKYKVHDERDETGAGDKVLIAQSRPLSKEKRWRLMKVLEKSKGAADLAVPG